LKLDEDEILSVIKMDLKKMIKIGKIQDSKTVCTIMTYVSKNKL
jgi:ADP-ribose pyrophosphatase